jgi:hypothetical protein
MVDLNLKPAETYGLLPEITTSRCRSHDNGVVASSSTTGVTGQHQARGRYPQQSKLHHRSDQWNPSRHPLHVASPIKPATDLSFNHHPPPSVVWTSKDVADRSHFGPIKASV